jgi:hypothetical protein
VAAEFSDEFAELARAEADSLRARAVELHVRSAQWAERARELAVEAARVEARLRDLDELLGRAPQLRLDLQTRELQGRRLREAAISILIERRGTRQPIHYRDWYALLRDGGIAATGKDPLATFLTQITRSPLVSRVAGRSGIYEVDPVAAYDRARAEVADATSALAAAEDASQQDESEAGLARLRLAQERAEAATRQLKVMLAARSSVLRESLTRAA